MQDHNNLGNKGILKVLMSTQKAFISLENQQNIIRMGIIFFFRPDSTIANKWDATYFHFTQKKNQGNERKSHDFLS